MRVHFSTDDVPPRDREQYWLDVVARQYMRVTPGDRPDPAIFRVQLDAEVTGRFTLYDFRTSHQSGGRTPADIARDNSQRFHLERAPSSRIYIPTTRGARFEEVRLAPDDFCITSGEWPHSCEMKGGTSLSGLVIPHAVLSSLLKGGRLTQPITVAAGSPLGSLLGTAF